MNVKTNAKAGAIVWVVKCASGGLGRNVKTSMKAGQSTAGVLD